jgi:hypothetical protein
VADGVGIVVTVATQASVDRSTFEVGVRKSPMAALVLASAGALATCGVRLLGPQAALNPVLVGWAFSAGVGSSSRDFVPLNGEDSG